MKFTEQQKHKLFFTSDLHYGHANICKATSKWLDGYRDFSSLEEMNETIISNINKYVGEDDYLFNLGDLVFGNKLNLIELINKINCKNVYVTYGNHDYLLTTNKPLNIDKNININPNSLFIKCEYQFDISVNKQHIVLGHFPFAIWNESHYGSWNLHGHCHGNFKDTKPNQLDVGIDNAYKIFGEYKPFSYSEINKILNKI